MNLYRLVVRYNEHGAIGAPEQVWLYLNAESSKEAYNKAREDMYAKNRDHVLVMKLEQDDDNGGYITVEPVAYLY